jgi:hypothetical protein
LHLCDISIPSEIASILAKATDAHRRNLVFEYSTYRYTNESPEKEFPSEVVGTMLQNEAPGSPQTYLAELLIGSYRSASLGQWIEE